MQAYLVMIDASEILWINLMALAVAHELHGELKFKERLVNVGSVRVRQVIGAPNVKGQPQATTGG